MSLWAVLMAAAFVACSATQMGSSANAAGSDVAVAIKTDRTAVAPGQALTITITVTNTSASAQQLRFATGCQTDYEFLDGAGNVVTSSHQMCTQALSQRTLEPGASFADSHVWTRGALDPNQVTPGNYQLRGVLLAVGDTVRSSTVPVSVP